MMKKIFIALAVLVVVIFAYSQHRKLQNYKDTAQLQAVELSTLKDSVKTIRQKNGDLSYQVKAVEIEKRNLRESLEVAGYEIKDLKQKEIRWRKINNVLKAELQSSGTGSAGLIDTFIVVKTETKTDTVYQSNFSWNNKYLFLNGNITGESITFDYRYNTSLDIVTFRKKKETLVSVSLTDPNASVLSSNSVTISHKKRWYEKPWVWGAAGFTTGLLISK